MKEPSLHIFTNTNDWEINVAESILLQAILAVQRRSQFTLCLAGGNTPKQIYECLARPPFREIFPWPKTHIFWGDERVVPRDHVDSNYRMANLALLDQVDIPRSQIFPLYEGGDLKTAVANYSSLLDRYFGRDLFTFDLTLLGLGSDGHTASLFPNTEILENTPKLVDSVWVPQLERQRISLTAASLNRSRQVFFLVAGEGKRNTVSEVLYGTKTSQSIPSKLIKPDETDVHWFLDREAAAAIIR